MADDILCLYGRVYAWPSVLCCAACSHVAEADTTRGLGCNHTTQTCSPTTAPNCPAAH